MSARGNAVYIVTGASLGIGRAVAEAVASRNHSVIAVARSHTQLESLSRQAKTITSVPADLTTTAGVSGVVANVPENAVIAGVVHAAGSLVPLEPFAELDGNTLADHFRIHVAAPITLYQALLKKHVVERMLFIDSYSALTPRHGWSAYSIVKAAAQMAAKCAAQELSPTETIRVFPGAVNTRIVKTVLASDTETAKAFAGMLQRGEFAEPNEVANFIVKLLMDADQQLLGSNDAWDYNDATHRHQVESLSIRSPHPLP